MRPGLRFARRIGCPFPHLPSLRPSVHVRVRPPYRETNCTNCILPHKSTVGGGGGPAQDRHHATVGPPRHADGCTAPEERTEERKKVHYPIKVSPLLRPISCPPAPAPTRTDGRTDSAFLGFPPPASFVLLHPFLPCVYAISFCTLLSVVLPGGTEGGWAMESAQRARSGSEGGTRKRLLSGLEVNG